MDLCKSFSWKYVFQDAHASDTYGSNFSQRGQQFKGVHSVIASTFPMKTALRLHSGPLRKASPLN